MKYYGKYLIFSILVILSFYATNKTALLVRNQDPILKEIKSVSGDVNVDYVNATINEDYIIPGMYGRIVDELKSLTKMKEQEAFNSLYLVTRAVKPDISLSDNLDKIIIQGNSKKNSLSFIIDGNTSKGVLAYLKKHDIKASSLVTKDTYQKNSFFEPINNDFTNYKELDKILKKDKLDTNICLLDRNNSNYSFCKKKKKYLVKTSLTLDNSNIITLKESLTSGSIIYLKDETYLDCLVEYIKSKDLKIVPLSELISENSANGS